MPWLSPRALAPSAPFAILAAFAVSIVACGGDGSPPTAGTEPQPSGEGTLGAAPAAEAAQASPGTREGDASLRVHAAIDGERVDGRERFLVDLRTTRDGVAVDADVRISSSGDGATERVAQRTGAGRYVVAIDAPRVAWLRVDVTTAGAALRDVKIPLPRLHEVDARLTPASAKAEKRAGQARVTWSPARDALVEEARVEVAGPGSEALFASDVLPDTGEVALENAALVPGAVVVVRRGLTQALTGGGTARVDVVARTALVEPR